MVVEVAMVMLMVVVGVKMLWQIIDGHFFLYCGR